MAASKVLVSSLTPASGGVATMTQFVLNTLVKGGCKPILAHYEPYGMSPHLSTPSFALARNRPGFEKRVAYDGIETYAIGAWLPELEFMHFHPGPIWKKLMERSDQFVSVSGNVLAGAPFSFTGRRFLAWVAAGWKEDRQDRVKMFPLYRKIIDGIVNSKIIERDERTILRSGHVMALSQCSRAVLNDIAGEQVVNGVLPMPIAHIDFRPDRNTVVPFRIGFSGRLSDPRKNIGLLLRAFKQIAQQNPKAELFLIGGEPDQSTLAEIKVMGIGKKIGFPGYLSRSELAALLPTLDVFVLPSHQEGLCIAALEAMACGCPVVSTRCGGPEEFVLDDETGYLVDFSPAAIADAVSRISADRASRTRLSKNAQQLVLEQYNQERCEQIFWNAFENYGATESEKMN